jgi:hypothetical protein
VSPSSLLCPNRPAGFAHLKSWISQPFYGTMRLQPFTGRRIFYFSPISRGIDPMNFRTLAPSIALSVLGLALITTAASAAELALAPAHHRSAHLRTGYVFWDDVYPPAIYGPNLRSVEEVAALKAEARPVSQRWWG